MSRPLTAIDACTLMNALYKQATGKSDIASVDLTNFASVGDSVMATGTENVFNTLALVMGRTMFAVRPYSAKLGIIDATSTGEFTHRIRKVSYYNDESIEAGFVNTDQSTNIADGYDNGTNSNSSTASMWKQKVTPILELNFYGQNVYQEELTVFEKQVSAAFRSADELASFINGQFVNKMNEIEQRKEAQRRTALIQHIGMTYQLGDSVANVMKGSAINLTAAFNSKFGTSYTSEQLRTTYLKEFLKFFVSEFKLTSDFMTENSVNYHWSVPKTVDNVTYNIARHTSKDNQKCVLYGPLFTEAEAWVLPEIFNPQYLSLENHEKVNYWQSINDRAQVKVKPNLPSGASVTAQKVTIPYVVGMLFDKDALLTDTQFESSAVTPLEARKKYRNMFWDYSWNVISDPTENCVLFYMKDAESSN